jgi:hypothetical protein
MQSSLSKTFTQTHRQHFIVTIPCVVTKFLSHKTNMYIPNAYNSTISCLDIHASAEIRYLQGIYIPIFIKSLKMAEFRRNV